MLGFTLIVVRYGVPGEFTETSFVNLAVRDIYVVKSICSNIHLGEAYNISKVNWAWWLPSNMDSTLFGCSKNPLIYPLSPAEKLCSSCTHIHGYEGTKWHNVRTEGLIGENVRHGIFLQKCNNRQIARLSHYMEVLSALFDHRWVSLTKVMRSFGVFFVVVQLE